MRFSRDRRSFGRATVALAGFVAFAGFCVGPLSAQKVEVAFDDFENLDNATDMVPFDLDYSSPYFLDGTDWSKTFPAGFTLDNSGNTYDNSTMPPEFDGWSMMDVGSWIGHAGEQAGRQRCFFGGDNRNTCLVADPDEADDGGNADMGSPENPAYNSYITRAYDVTGVDLSTLMLSFDYDFVTEDTQTGVVEVSFDGGAWETILEIDSTIDSGVFSTNKSEVPEENDQGTFVAGIDFTAPASATSMEVRFGCIRSSNDWWFAVDNIELMNAGGQIAFDDFEGPTPEMPLADQPFSDANDGPDEPFDPSDGTDYTNNIPNWEIINDGPADMPTKRMYRTSLDGAFQGFTVMDSISWTDQQDGQQREDFFGAFRSMILCADGDAHQDNMVIAEEETLPAIPVDGEGNPTEKQFNSFVQRTYNMSGYDNTTVEITLDWDTRLYAAQRGLIQVSFDDGANWTTLVDVDSARLGLVGEEGSETPADPAYEASLNPYLFNDNNANGFVDENGEDTVTGIEDSYVFGGFGSELPASKSNRMTLRIGCINTGNDWWFAVDNIEVLAATQSYVMGDITGDGVCSLADFNGFVSAAFGAPDPQGIFDFNADGMTSLADFNGFVAEAFAPPLP
ncbi:hypothetical protein [Crateriforma conspicua]|uniref:Uncharacterized protein n=1 Tax=Crateriforma conspicua TaxID=2527996 RepID=A0A5C5Y3S4_9PLAN|nr:hypothetical protein [Crateriforma conspicua]TWT69804.1 hypothetical protein Pan14r_20980 [Crateriforma conspicua]